MKKTKTVQSYKNTAKDTERATRKTDKSNFSDPVKIQDQNPQDQPKEGIKSPWDFRCPQYDQRSGNFVNAGTHYGVGYRSPVGHKGPAKQEVPCLPLRRLDTMQDDDLG
jgi:hypothetical protein